MTEIAKGDDAPVLEVRDLYTYFVTRDGVAKAVDGVEFDVRRGETLGIVGESGCGKSVTALTVMRLLPMPPARVMGGPVLLGGRNLLDLSEPEMRRVRGNRISMIFQEPMTSLNPVLTIGRQMREAVMLHRGVGRAEAQEHAAEALHMVQIPEPALRLGQYPYEFSGGMRQRVMIAMALSCNPEILIADEPTTALDVTIQAQILDLILALKEQTRTGVILITHDLGVVAETAQRVLIMYTGRTVEEGIVKEIFARPAHPYTRGLLNSLPRLGSSRRGDRYTRLEEIKGIVPSLLDLPPGCSFAPRCPFAGDRCRIETPPLAPTSAGHRAACWQAETVLQGVVP
jgi:oligopeptide/dipeptide ABC transporter ATP-binding protein